MIDHCQTIEKGTDHSISSKRLLGPMDGRAHFEALKDEERQLIGQTFSRGKRHWHRQADIGKVHDDIVFSEGIFIKVIFFEVD